MGTMKRKRGRGKEGGQRKITGDKTLGAKKKEGENNGKMGTKKTGKENAQGVPAPLLSGAIWWSNKPETQCNGLLGVKETSWIHPWLTKYVVVC